MRHSQERESRERPRRGRAGVALLCFTAALIAVVGAGWWWVWRVRQRFRAPLERGQELLDLRRYDEAEALLRAAHEAQPDDPTPLRGIAACHLGRGRHDEAMAWAERAAAKDTGPDARVLAAEIALAAAGPWDAADAGPRIGDWDPRPRAREPKQEASQAEKVWLPRALEQAEAAAKQWPECASAFRVLAVAMARRGDVAGSVAHIRRAVELGPEAVGSRLAAADILALRAAGEAEPEAAALCHEALDHCRYVAERIGPPGDLSGQDKADLLRALGRAARVSTSLGLADQAVAFWRRYLDAGGDRVRGHAGLAIASYVKGDYPQAVKEGESAARYAGANKSWEAHYFKGKAYLAQKSYAEAAQDLRVAITVRNDAQAQHLLGTALLAAGDRLAAHDAFKEARDLDPRHFAARRELVKLLEADGEADAALEELRRGIAVAPDAREAQDALAQFCLRHGRDDEAEKALLALHGLKPPSAKVAADLAEFYLGRGDPERALPLAREAVALEPGAAGFIHGVGRVEAALGRVADAADSFALALSKDRACAPAYLDWARMLEEAGDRAGALAIYERARRAVPGSVAVRCAYARFCIAAGREDDGLAELKLAIDRDQRDLAARTILVEHSLASGKKEAALTQARETLEALPRSPEAHALAVRVHRARGEWDKVLALLKRMAQLPGGAAAALPLRLAAQLHEGFPSGAIELAGEAAQPRSKQRPDVALIRAVLAFFAGDREKALDAAGRCASGNPRDPDAGYVVSLMKLGMGHPALSAPACREFALPDVAREAWTDLEQLQKRSQDIARRVASLLLHAYVYEEVGWHDTAAEQMEAILKVAPDCLAACVMGPLLWERAGSRARAIALCESVLKRRADFAHGRLILAELLLLDGQLERAQGAYAECAAAEPAPFEAGTKLALIAMAAGDAAAALERWRAIARAEPRQMPAACNLAWLLATKPEPDLPEAVTAAANATEAAPDEPAALDTKGWVSFLNGETVPAIDVLEKAVQAAPYRAIARLHLGLAYARGRQAAKAERELQAAIELAPREPLADTARRALRDLRLGIPD